MFLGLWWEGDVMVPYGSSADPHVALGDPTYWLGQRGAKGRGVRRMGLPNEAGGVDLVVQGYYLADAAGHLADPDPRGGQEVGRALVPGKVGLRIARVTTTGASVSTRRSRTKAVSSMVSVP